MLNNNKIALALILGSGIDLYSDMISDKRIISREYKGVHLKSIFLCRIAGKEVLVFKGRKHFYEGYNEKEITANIVLAGEMGAENILLTNAAGGLNENFSEGDLMMITSHINFISKLNFKPVNKLYDKVLQDRFRNSCIEAGVKLQEGTYGCYSGPTYETKAEVRFQKKFKLDAAGMSTVPEVLSGAALNFNLIAVSVITNILKENISVPANHESVINTAAKASESLNKILPLFISQLN